MDHAPDLKPFDEHNRKLQDNAHPPEWSNPRPADCYNLVVVGGGTAGLVAAAGAAGLGAKVALVERAFMGGDCLNFGCVPSKTLIRSARAAFDVREAGRYGIRAGAADAGPGADAVDFAAVMERVRSVRAGISAHDAVRRFRDLGVDVFLGPARFIGPDAVELGDARLRFRKAVIAVGTRPNIPEAPGLAESNPLTNETVFGLTERPPRLLVLGGGPIGCELAQAFQRLGSRVTVVEKSRRLLRIAQDEDASRLCAEALRDDGVELRLGAMAAEVELEGSVRRVRLRSADGSDDLGAVETDAILVALGRTPNVEGLDLEAAGVDWDAERGVLVDDALRTSNRRIFAAGDCAMKAKFTHMADAAARIVVRNALFPFLPKARLSSITVPWCIYTDPEIAHTGLSEGEARESGVEVDVYRIGLDEVDRAWTNGESGLLKVLTRKGKDEILGATFLARDAGDIISEITLAIEKGVGLGGLSSVVHPYPTIAEAIKKAADACNRGRLTDGRRRILSWLMRIQRR